MHRELGRVHLDSACIIRDDRGDSSIDDNYITCTSQFCMHILSPFLHAGKVMETCRFQFILAAASVSMAWIAPT